MQNPFFFAGRFKQEFLSHLSSADFLNKTLISTLTRNSPVISKLRGRLDTIGILENVTQALIANGEEVFAKVGLGEFGVNFETYLETKHNNLVEKLNKISEVTGQLAANIPLIAT